jgi:ATP adenylyltransferase
MDRLWTPWRYAYITTADQATACIFCELPKKPDDEALIVYRGRMNYVVLNAFPYTSGHVMVVPYEHLDELQKVTAEAASEMIGLCRRLEGVLRAAYRPEGINLGMNIGKVAGAGVAGHVHMHMLPRWTADANFMTTVGETRVLPEDLTTTYQKLKGKLD